MVSLFLHLVLFIADRPGKRGTEHDGVTGYMPRDRYTVRTDAQGTSVHTARAWHRRHVRHCAVLAEPVEIRAEEAARGTCWPGIAACWCCNYYYFCHRRRCFYRRCLDGEKREPLLNIF